MVHDSPDPVFSSPARTLSDFEIELYPLTPAAFELTLAQVGLAPVAFLPQSLKQQGMQASVTRPGWLCNDASSPSLLQNHQLRLCQGQYGSHRQALVGRALIRPAIFVYFVSLLLPFLLSSLLAFVCYLRTETVSSTPFTIWDRSFYYLFICLWACPMHCGMGFFDPASLHCQLSPR